MKFRFTIKDLKERTEAEFLLRLINERQSELMMGTPLYDALNKARRYIDNRISKERLGNNYISLRRQRYKSGDGEEYDVLFLTEQEEINNRHAQIPSKPGQYRLVKRKDIYFETYEDGTVGINYDEYSDTFIGYHTL